jgi:hypothetical protein
MGDGNYDDYDDYDDYDIMTMFVIPTMMLMMFTMSNMWMIAIARAWISGVTTGAGEYAPMPPVLGP